MVTELTTVGGLLILRLGLVLLEIKPIRVASFLPALVAAPPLVPPAEWLAGCAELCRDGERMTARAPLPAPTHRGMPFALCGGDRQGAGDGLRGSQAH